MPGGLFSCSPLEVDSEVCEVPCSLGPHSSAHRSHLHRAGSLPCSPSCRQKPWEGCRRKGLLIACCASPLPSTLCCFLDTWIDQYPEEFSQTILKKLKTYLTVNMPSSDLNVRVHMLLKELRQESNESEGKGEDSVSLPVTFLYKTESAADLSSSVEVRSYTSGDLEMEAWFPSGNVQPELAYLQETETLESTIKVISWD